MRFRFRFVSQPSLRKMIISHAIFSLCIIINILIQVSYSDVVTEITETLSETKNDFEIDKFGLIEISEEASDENRNLLDNSPDDGSTSGTSDNSVEQATSTSTSDPIYREIPFPGIVPSDRGGGLMRTFPGLRKRSSGTIQNGDRRYFTENPNLKKDIDDDDADPRGHRRVERMHRVRSSHPCHTCFQISCCLDFRCHKR